MGIMRFNYRSQAIGQYVDITITIPTDGFSYYDISGGARHHTLPNANNVMPVYRPGMKFQTVYLMHGGGDDDSLVFRYTNAERYADRNRVMLVVPNVANSFGVDTNYGRNYSTFITEELPVVIQSLFPSSPAREDNFIVGYAMGGNAALGNALMHPELYRACVDMSGGIGLTVNTETLKNELESEHFSHFPIYLSTFGPSDELEGSRHDMALAARRNLERGVELPDFHIICGSDEFIRERVEADVRTLREIGYQINYICPEGYRHDFDLWDKYLQVVFDELLPLRRAAIDPVS